MAVSSKASQNNRVWNNEDLYEDSDTWALFNSEKVKYTRPAVCSRYLGLYLTLAGFFILFFVGLMIGVFVRVDPKTFDSKSCARDFTRADGFDKHKLQAVHNNIMHFITLQHVEENMR